MGFNKETANIEPLDFDFTDFGVTGEGATGTIPEPSQAAMKTFQKFQSYMSVELQKLRKIDLTEIPADKLEAKMKEVTDRSDTLEGELDAALSKLCGNVPTLAILKKLTFRAKQAFSAWLMKQFYPEA